MTTKKPRLPKVDGAFGIKVVEGQGFEPWVGY